MIPVIMMAEFLKYATFQNSSLSKIFKVNDGVPVVVARYRVVYVIYS